MTTVNVMNKIPTDLESLDLSSVTYGDKKGPKKVNQYVLGEKLGSGSYGKVKEAIDSKSLRRVAIKIIKLANVLKKQKKGEEIKNEVVILKKLKHKNVIEILDVIENKEKKKYYIVLEFAGAGSLDHVIDSHPNKRLTKSYVWRFFTQLIDGLDYLHSRGVVHKDIKPSNLMITPNGTLKISDFGVAEELSKFSSDDKCTYSNGTPTFQSPQVAKGDKVFHGFANDVWSAGVTLYYMATGKYPFEGDNLFNLYESISKGSYKLDLKEFKEDKALLDLIKGMLEPDEKKRLTIKEIKSHKWFKEKKYETEENEKKTTSCLVDRWRSFSLLPYISKAINESSDLPEIKPSSDTEDDKKQKGCPLM